MKKTLLLKTLLLLCALIVGSTSAWATDETITIQQSDAGLFYESSTTSTTVHSFQKSSVDFAITGSKTKSSAAATSGYGYIMLMGGQIYNTSTLDGKYISNVTITYTANTGTSGRVIITVGSSTLSTRVTTGGTTPTKGGTLSLDNDNTEYGYFNISNNNNSNTQISKIEITFKDKPTDPFINASDKEIAYNATSGSIGYSLQNGIGNVTAAVTTGSDWLTVITEDITASEVPFTCSANTGFTARTATVTLSFTGASDKVVTVTQAAAPILPISITLSGTYPTTFIVGDEFSHEGMTVTATYSDNSTSDVTASATFTGYDMSATGEQTVTVSYTEGTGDEAITKTATYNITVNPIPTKTIAQFIAAGGGKCYLVGTISNDAENKYGNYDLTDDSGTIYVYGTLTSAGVSQQYLTLGIGNGDMIKVLADEYVYFNNTTHEAKNVRFIEKIEATKHNLTVNAANGSVEITGKTLDINNKCEVAENTSVTATATPAEHYTFTSWSATGVDITANATDNPLTFTMPTDDVTLTATFTEMAKHTATFYVQGVAAGSDANVYEGDAITFPTNITVPTGYTLVGWTTAEISGAQAAAPSPLVSSATMGTADVSYYAVFAIASGSMTTATLTESEIKTKFTNAAMAYNDDPKSYSDTSDGVTWTVKGYATKDVPWVQLRKNATVAYMKISASNNISNIKFTITNTTVPTGQSTSDINNHGAFGGYIVLLDSPEANATQESDGVLGYTNSVSSNVANVAPTSSVNEVYVQVTAAARIWGVEVTCGSSSYSDYCTTVTATATIPANKEWITFCSTENLDFTSDIAGLEGAYTITAHADKATALTATKMTGKVKAGTGLLLRAKTVSATDAQVINIPVAATGEEQADNMLKGVTEDTEIAPTTGEYTNLGLKDGEFHPYTNGPSDMAKLKAGKAYLQIPTAQMPTGGNNARLYIVLDGEATGINAIENSELRIENLDAPMYNLAGQKVSKSYKGVVIVNGKKFINK